MTHKLEFRVQQIAQMLDARVEGDADRVVSSFGKIETAQEGELTFLANDKYRPFIYTTRASAVLVSNDFSPEQPIQASLIRVTDPYAALAQLMQFAESQLRPRRRGVDPRAVVAEHAQVGADCYIGANAIVEAGVVLGEGCQIYPNTFIGEGTKVGAGTVVYPNATIYHGVVIGERCIIHAGAVVGADGFGFAPQLDGYHKIPQLGNVILEDDVEIGANTCIDRAAMGSTIIKRGAKLDNLVQIAHNCQVGEHTVLASQVGMAGSSTIGSWCQAGGQAGIAGHLSIGDRVQLGGQTGVLGDIKSDRSIFGSPAMELGDAMRSFVIIPKLPDMYRRLGKLEKEIEIIKLKE
ncbi:MAG: UDP-3-O-(3-hydroxymyristoyl)glucosamine N-acyltransferase [Porphyromonadaceae bacterium]|nr:UDP-3-O-(3-hydroxymyristoyl)glucosamine N-acyltransferase [Porphyromonadaceae bacterium]